MEKNICFLQILQNKKFSILFANLISERKAIVDFYISEKFRSIPVLDIIHLIAFT